MAENQGVASSILAWATRLPLAWVLLAGPVAAQPTDRQIVHSRAADRLVASLSIGSGEVGGDALRTVRVYGDGRVRARYPAYLKNAGEREIQLPAGELDALVLDLASGGLPELEPAAVRARCAALESASGELHWVSGADWIEIELHLDAYRGPGQAAARPLRQRVAWRGLTQDLQRFPSVGELRALAAARDRLAALLARDDLAVAP